MRNNFGKSNIAVFLGEHFFYYLNIFFWLFLSKIFLIFSIVMFVILPGQKCPGKIWTEIFVFFWNRRSVIFLRQDSYC